MAYENLPDAELVVLLEEEHQNHFLPELQRLESFHQDFASFTAQHVLRSQATADLSGIKSTKQKISAMQDRRTAIDALIQDLSDWELQIFMLTWGG